MSIVLVVFLVLASGALFVFAAHVDALTGRIGWHAARNWRERLRRHRGRLRAAPWRARPAVSAPGK
ncbi:hypothetical protein LFL97_24940 [Burkholderia sp. JSH-S8]|nr:hypothetical protein LFL97_24940 [Burkholderia sp. JSH-S8]